MELEDGLDDLLADLDVPTSPKKLKTEDLDEPQPNKDLSSGNSKDGTTVTKPSSSKTHCILVNQKQPGPWTTEKEGHCNMYPHVGISNRKPYYATSMWTDRGNPLLKFITSVPWEYDDIIPDYEIGRTICALFISLRYHNMNPDYINNRLKELGKRYDLRVLLVQVDLKDPHTPLKNLTRICLLADLTLMLAWSPEEAAQVLENYKIFENKPPDKIMEKIENDPHQKIINALTSVKAVNKTDAMTLLTNFGTLENIIKAPERKLAECPGFAATKAKKLYKALHEPFLKRSQVNKPKEKSDFNEDLSIEDIEQAEKNINNE